MSHKIHFIFKEIPEFIKGIVEEDKLKKSIAWHCRETSGENHIFINFTGMFFPFDKVKNQERAIELINHLMITELACSMISKQDTYEHTKQGFVPLIPPCSLKDNGINYGKGKCFVGEFIEDYIGYGGYKF